MSPRKAAFGMILLCVATVLFTGPLAPYIRNQPREAIETDRDMLRRILRFRRRTGLWPLDSRELTPAPTARIVPRSERASLTFRRRGPPQVWRRLESWTGQGRLEHRLELDRGALLVRSHWLPQAGSSPAPLRESYEITSSIPEDPWSRQEAEVILRDRIRREPGVFAHRLRLAALLQQDPKRLNEALDLIPGRLPDGRPRLSFTLRRADLLRRTGRRSQSLHELKWLSTGLRRAPSDTTKLSEDARRALSRTPESVRLKAFALLDRLGGFDDPKTSAMIAGLAPRPRESGVLTWLRLRRLGHDHATGRISRDRVLEAWDRELVHYESWIDTRNSYQASFATPVYSLIFRALRERLAGRPGSACEAARVVIRRAADPTLIRMDALAVVGAGDRPSGAVDAPTRIELPPLPVPIFDPWRDR